MVDAAREPQSHLKWLPLAILLAGMALRVAYCAGNDVRHVHDDHFKVIKIWAEKSRWPLPHEDWEAYQPPLYHAGGAVVYTATTQVAGALGADAELAHAAGRKTVQFISAIAGCATLYFVYLILRMLIPAQIGLLSTALAVAAFLPRHVYMSGMATNDALCYLWMTMVVWALLRWHAAGGAWVWAIVAGVCTGLALLTKPYGLASMGLVIVAVPIGALVRSSAEPEQTKATRVVGSGLVAIIIAAALGAAPYVRNYQITGKPFVSNYEIVENAIHLQPPGTLGRVSFASFRLPALLDRPWVHVDTLDSFWTELYARTWFDYGTSLTLFHYKPFVEHTSQAWSQRQKPPEQRLLDQLTWDVSVAPKNVMLEGRVLLILGLVPTALVLAGFSIALVRSFRSFACAIITANLLGNLAIPIFQTFRQPYYSSMKATFALGAIASAAVLFAWGAEWLRWRERKWLRILVVANVVALAAVLAVHLVHVAYFPPDYFMDPGDRV